MKMRGVPFALAAVAATALAGCGSSTSNAKPLTTRPTAAAPAPVVEIASNAKLGSLLVDAQGMTLYTLTSSGHPVACTGQCAKFWPPLMLPSGTSTASGAAGVTDLGTVARATGLQIAQKGAPLYRFSADKAPGDANGEGISSFGGVWHVVKASGASGAGTPTTNVPVTNAPHTSTTNGYGY